VNLQRPAPALDMLYAAVGRALALAVSFEHTCYAVALLVESFEEVKEAGVGVLADPGFVQRIFDGLQGKKLNTQIKAVFATFPLEQLRSTVEEGRLARNKLVHDLLKPHDVLIEHEEGRAMLMEELKTLVARIAVADEIMGQLFDILSGNGLSDEEELLKVAQRTEIWVMGAAVQELPEGS
jgi:hypothetical protein